MSELKDILNDLDDVRARISTVILCNPKQKEVLQKASKEMNNVYLIENCHIKLNEAILMKDLEMKKMLISNFKRKENADCSINQVYGISAERQRNRWED